MSWSEGPMALFDLETTAPDPFAARIVTSTIVIYRPAAKLDAREWLADPGIEIPPGAVEVHGISTEHARTFGRPAAEVVGEVGDVVRSVWAKGMPLVGYNLGSYDLTVLAAEHKRHGLAAFTCEGPVVDGRVLDQYVDRYRKGKRQLTHVAEHYRVALDGAHSATEDALAAGRVVWRIAQRYPQIARMPLDELHTAQGRWYAEKQRSFAEYLRTRRAGELERRAAQAEYEHRDDDAEQARAELADTHQQATEIDANADQWPIREGNPHDHQPDHQPTADRRRSGPPTPRVEDDRLPAHPHRRPRQRPRRAQLPRPHRSPHHDDPPTRRCVMPSGPEHYQLAEMFAGWAEDARNNDNDAARLFLAQAQVHATLALAAAQAIVALSVDALTSTEAAAWNKALS